MPINYSENTQILRGLTTEDNANNLAPGWTTLDDQLGAPWEISIKSFVPNDSNWGEATYTNTGNSDISGSINSSRAKEIGGSIHRMLKYYLGTNYKVNDIQAVKLNVSIKTPVPASGLQEDPVTAI